MRANDLAWLTAVERYVESRDVSDYYRETVRLIGRKFAEFAGEKLRIDCLTDSLVNQWLESLRDGLSPRRIHHYRSAVLSIWREEFARGNAKRRPEFVRRIKVPRQPVRCWTQDELRAFVTACKIVPGQMRDQSVNRAFWWATFANLDYDTGLRRSDALTVPWDWYDAASGTIQRTQDKTGNVVTLWLNPTTVAMVNRMDRTQPYVLTWPYHTTKFDYWMRKIVKAAGIRKGTSRWIRRSAASYTERNFPGHASRLLGHATPGMVRFYLDPSITNATPIRPPEL